MKKEFSFDYNWKIALLINIGIFILFIPGQSVVNALVILCISIFISIIPLLESKKNIEFKKQLVHGIPFLVIICILILCSIFNSKTCTGNYCQLSEFILGWGFGLYAVFFTIIYTSLTYFTKCSSIVNLFYSLIVPPFIAILGLWIIQL